MPNDKKITGVILAAGKGTRLAPFGTQKPKPLYKVLNKPVLQYGLDELAKFCQQIIVITGYLSEQIEEFLSTLPYADKIQTVYQEEPYNQGNAYAVKLAQGHIKGEEFILINGDDIYDSRFYTDIQEIPGRVIMSKFIKDWQGAGIFKISNGLMKEVIEKPKEFIGNAGNINFVKFLTEDLKYLSKIVPNPIRGELEITDFYNAVASDHAVKVIEKFYNFDQIGYPHQLLGANLNFLKNKKQKKLIGKNCIIDEASTIVNSVIGDNCVIGKNVIIRDSVLGDRVTVLDNGSVEYSVIGDNNYLSDPKIAKIKLRPQGPDSTVKVEVKGRMIDTELPMIGINLAENSLNN